MNASEVRAIVERALVVNDFLGGTLTMLSYDERNFGDAVFTYIEGSLILTIRRDRGQFILDIRRGDESVPAENIYPEVRLVMETGSWTLDQLLSAMQHR